MNLRKAKKALDPMQARSDWVWLIECPRCPCGDHADVGFARQLDQRRRVQNGIVRQAITLILLDFRLSTTWLEYFAGTGAEKILGAIRQ
jgi:hypothetical protein